MSVVKESEVFNVRATPIFRFESKPKVITLCGSTRFWKLFQEWNAKLTLQGNLVFSVAVPSTAQSSDLAPREKSILDEVHLHKIRMSDEVFVINEDGYIGESTANEIRFATKIGRTVTYLETPPSGPLFEN